MAIFKYAYTNGKRYALKIIKNEGEAEAWFNTSEAVYNFCKENYKDGDDIIIEYAPDGKKQKIVKVTRGGGGAVTTTEKKVEPTTTTKAPETKPASTYSGYQKSPDINASIVKQYAMKCATQALLVLQGTIDVNSVSDVIDALYERIYSKIK